MLFSVILFALTVLFAPTASAGPKTLTINAGRDIFEDDTGVYDYWEFDDGGTTRRTLYVGTFVAPYNYSHIALGFNLAGKLENMSVISVELVLDNYMVDGTPNLTAHGSDDDSWTESSDTTFPATSGAALFSEDCTSLAYTSPDIKDYILSEYAGDQYATIVLDSSPTSIYNDIVPYASEQSGTAPQLKVTYIQPSVAISTASSLTEDNLNGMDVSVEITDDTFNPSLNIWMFTLNGDARASGVSIDSVTYGDATHATLHLQSTTDFDEHFNLQVTVEGTATASGLSTASNTLSVHAYDEITAAGTYDLDDMGTEADIVVSTTGHVKLIHTSSSSPKYKYAVTCTVSNADLEIDNINMDNYYYYTGYHCISFTGAGNTLTLTGNSKLKTYNMPAVIVQSGTELTIEGTGKLVTSASSDAAAIGAGNAQALGEIVINGGTVIATGGSSAAAIGGGKNGSGGSVTINGGTITATGGINAAGIGSGAGAAAGIGSIAVTGGTITAAGGNGDGAGIGGGENSTIGTITISGGTVTAGYSGGVGIGCGKAGSVSEITIAGGIVYAKNGGTSDAGIGGDVDSVCSTINMTGGRIYAEGNADNANDIGYGQNGSDTDGTLQVNISGTSVVFLKNNLLSDRNDGISIPFHDDETIVDHTAYLVTVPDDWSGTAYAYISNEIPVSAVSLAPETARLNATVGETTTLTTTITPAYASDRSVAFSSSDTGVALVDASGVVTAVAEGTATITVTTTDGGYTDTCLVTVYIGVSGVSLSPATQTLVLGDADTGNDTVTLTATVSPDSAEDQTVSYQSSDTGVASVDASGVVTAVAAGTATITVTTTDGGLTDTCAITVEQRVTGVSVAPAAATLVLDDGNPANDAVTAAATVLPADADDQRVTWASNNTAVATVDASTGVITAVAAGTATITATTVDGSFTDTCAVTVEQRVTGVSVSPVAATLVLDDGNPANDAVTATATVSPADADDKSITWSSSDTGVATVGASTGVITAVAAGTATITATTTDGGLTDTCAITVEQRVTGVSVAPAAATLVLDDGNPANDAVTLTATVSPSDADVQTVSWSSSDPAVAIVDASGAVTAVAAGTATITATTTDGGLTDTCVVTVNQKVTGLSVSPSAATLVLDDGNPANDAVTATATVSPADADDKSITWSSSDTGVATVGASTGVITAVAAGTATITATTTDGGLTDTCAITVEQRVTGVSVSPDTAALVLDDGNPANDAVTLTATVSPSDADVQTVSWSSSDPAVAIVDASGAVTAVAAGTATITATTTDGGWTADCTVTVEQKVTGVTVSPAAGTLVIGDADTANDTLALTATVIPADADEQGVTWSSSDASVAAVDAAGVVTALKKGTAVITAATIDGGLTDTCDITVEQEVRILPDANDGRVCMGGCITLTPSVSGGTWIYDPTHLSCSGNVFTPLRPGTSTVTYTMAPPAPGSSHGILDTLLGLLLPRASAESTDTASITITSEALTLTSSLSGGMADLHESFTLTPNFAGGTWSFDENVLRRNGYDFTTQTTAKTTVTYTYQGQTVSYTLEVFDLSPQTGDERPPLSLYALLAGLAALCLGYLHMRLRRRREGKPFTR